MMWNHVDLKEAQHESTSQARYIGQNVGITGAALARPCGHMGRRCRRQPVVHQRDFLDIAHRRSVAGFAAGLRGLKECAAAVLPLARQGDLGGVAGNAY